MSSTAYTVSLSLRRALIAAVLLLLAATSQSHGQATRDTINHELGFERRRVRGIGALMVEQAMVRDSLIAMARDNNNVMRRD
jgi:hypothetical protein